MADHKSRPTSEIHTSETIKTKMVIDIWVKSFNLKVDQPMQIRLIWQRQKNQAKTKWKQIGESGNVQFDEKFQINTNQYLDLDTDIPVKKTQAKMIAQLEDGFILGEADFDMSDFSYDQFKPHRLYLKQQMGSPVQFDENDKQTFIDLGIKGHKADGSPSKSQRTSTVADEPTIEEKVETEKTPPKPEPSGTSVQISQILFKSPMYVCSIQVGEEARDMDVPEEPVKKVVYKEVQEWKGVQMDQNGSTLIKINDDMIAELKMKSSETTSKKWLKIQEDGKDVGKIQVSAQKPLQPQDSENPFQIAEEIQTQKQEVEKIPQEKVVQKENVEGTKLIESSREENLKVIEKPQNQDEQQPQKNEEKQSSWFGIFMVIGVVAVGAIAYAKIIKKI